MELKLHGPIKVVLEVTCLRACALQTGKFQPLPKPETDLDPVDLQHLEEEIIERCVGAFEEAVNFQDVNLIWALWTAMAEAFLLERTTLETEAKSSCSRTASVGRGHAANTSKVRLGNRGRQFEGVEMHPQKRGLRTMHNLLQAMIRAGAGFDQQLYQNLWDKICRLGREFLKGKAVFFRWNHP